MTRKPSSPIVPDMEAVYDAIAEAWARTRSGAWPAVRQFLASLPRGTLLADVGAGSGRYFEVDEARGLKILGLDLSKGQLEVARASPARTCGSCGPTRERSPCARPARRPPFTLRCSTTCSRARSACTRCASSAGSCFPELGARVVVGRKRRGLFSARRLEGAGRATSSSVQGAP